MKKPYNCKEWRDLSRKIRSAHPICVECLKLGRHSPAKHVDHSHGFDNREDFFGQGKSELVPLCISCHTIKTNEFDKKNKLRDNLTKIKEFDI